MNATPLLDRTFHHATGPHGSHEVGFDSRIRLFKDGSKWIGLLTLQTESGPVSLSACADANVMRGFLSKLGPTLGPAMFSGALSQHQAPRISKMGATDVAQSNIREEAARRIYNRLVQRDPAAWEGVKSLIALAQSGDAHAMNAWRALLTAHRNASQKLSTVTASAVQEAAAARLYARLKAGDSSAWRALVEIAESAEQGNPAAARAWEILADTHKGTTFAGLPSSRPTIGAMPALALAAISGTKTPKASTYLAGFVIGCYRR